MSKRLLSPCFVKRGRDILSVFTLHSSANNGFYWGLLLKEIYIYLFIYCGGGVLSGEATTCFGDPGTLQKRRYCATVVVMDGPLGPAASACRAFHHSTAAVYNNNDVTTRWIYHRKCAALIKTMSRRVLSEARCQFHELCFVSRRVCQSWKWLFLKCNATS